MKRLDNNFSKELVIKVCNDHKGIWKDIMNDARIRVHNCFQRTLEPIVHSYLESFDNLFFKWVKDGEHQKVKNWINDWKVCLDEKV